MKEFGYDGNIETLIEFFKTHHYPDCKYTEFSLHGNDELFLYHYQNQLYFRGFPINLNAKIISKEYDVEIIN